MIIFKQTMDLHYSHKSKLLIPNISIVVLLLSTLLFSSSSALKDGETCSDANSCDKGLHCDSCAATGNNQKKCHRITPTTPTSKVKGLPFNKYSWLTTHNSFALMGATSPTGAKLIAPMNQDDNVTSQLNNGVRGLMLDMYDFNNDVWLCHSFQGKCYNVTAFEPAVNVLKVVQAFLEANPLEIVTIIIEDYVASPKGVSKVFDAAGLRKYWFPVNRMPKNGEDWPTVDDMVAKNQRLVVFTSKQAKEASEGIAYQWNYMVENQYGNGGLIAGTCKKRDESSPMDTKSRSLVLQNYFPDNPDLEQTCRYNSVQLVNMVKTCSDAAGKRWPNFIAVDFYMRTDGGGVPRAVDVANGHMTCGCDNIAYCKANATFGTCTAPPASEAPSTSKPASDQDSSGGAILGSRLGQFWCLIGTFSTVILMVSWL